MKRMLNESDAGEKMKEESEGEDDKINEGRRTGDNIGWRIMVKIMVEEI